jgi:hypothetical protein
MGAKSLARAAALAAAVALLAVAAPSALAVAPANDDIATPQVIQAIPFSLTLDTTDATSSPSDPGYCFAPEIGPDPGTVWFEYTATDTGPLGATTFGSDYDTTLYVGTKNAAGGFEQIACGDDSRTVDSAVRFDATEGTTYLFMVGASPFGGVNGGSLMFNLDVGPPSQAVDVTLDPDGTLVKKQVRFTGTVSCTAPTTFQSAVVVELDQGEGRKAADYIGFADITECPGTDIPFEILLDQQLGKVKTGPVTLQVIFAACNDFECGNDTIESMEATVSKK